MKVVHITEYSHAGSVGGTERYILDLIRALTELGHSSAIGWLTAPVQRVPITEQGVRILPLPAPAMRVDAALPGLTQAALQLLHDEKPDLLHFHTFGFSEALLARMGREHGIPYAFTYHSPAWTCRRETLLYRGAEPCDGEVRPWRCSACQSEQRLGGSWMAANAAAAASLAFGWAALPLGRNSLRRRSGFFYDTLRYRRVLRRFLAECDLVVFCCDWSGPVLLRNGARECCMIHCPQGVPNAILDALRSEPRTVSASIGKEFIVGYVGRVVEIKGPHILMEGFSQMKADEARLRIVGYDASNPHLPYSQRLQKLAQADSRIELVPKKSLDDTLAEYRRMSLLAIPSIWMETGPLTLLEALAAGVPVFGSKRIGQLNLLREHGRIVEPNTPDGWRAALTDALKEFRDGRWTAHRARIRATVSIRSMNDVASEMARHFVKGPK